MARSRSEESESGKATIAEAAMKDGWSEVPVHRYIYLIIKSVFYYLDGWSSYLVGGVQRLNAWKL